MLMDKAHPSRWPKRKATTANVQRLTPNAHFRMSELNVGRKALKELCTDLQNVGQRALPRIRRLESRLFSLLVASVLIMVCPNATALSPAEARRIGKKIWQNECNGTISGLTSWNSGENFASLGIGHFIWYPEGVEGPFEESFPPLVAFISSRGAKLPPLLTKPGGALHCPWKSRAEFLASQQTAEMKQLRQFLADTVDLQSEFLVDRLSRSLPKMLDEASPSNRGQVRENFDHLLKSSQGCYALVDYVNFKGEGVLHSERYQGQGWGLLQVLEEMKTDSADPLQEFSRAAAVVLKRRVRNAPPARNEQRWLSGWLKRVNSYTRD